MERLTHTLIAGNPAVMSRRGFVAGSTGMLAGAVALGILGTGASAGADEASGLADGTYTAQAQGHNAPLEVQVTVEGGVVSDVEVTSHNETVGIGTVAIEKIPPQIVESQSLAVDTVTGASVTSAVLLNVVADCIEQAGGSRDAFSTPIEREMPELQEMDADVLVIGAGLGGLCAAIEAEQAGADVIVIEKQGFAGGNSLLSTGILQAAGSSLQKAQGIEDSPEQYYADMMELTEGQRDPNLVEIVTQTSGATIDWLIDNGSVFNDEVTQGVGSEAKRAHSSKPDASGLDLGLAETCEAGCTVLYETGATEFLTDADGNVTGAKAEGVHGEQYVINASKTILACGGFGANKDMVVEYAGEWARDMMYAGSAGTTGEMIQAALDLGAEAVDIDQLFHSPTTDIELGMLITATVLSNGGILCNHAGERFTNETGSPNDYLLDINATGEDFVYEVFNDDVADKVYKVRALYMQQGIVGTATDIDDLAEQTGMPLDALVATFDELADVAAGAQDTFGRYLNTSYDTSQPLYFIKVKAGYLSTNGGLRVNENAQVMKADGSVLGNLYSTGDTVGGYRPYGYVCGDANMLAAAVGRVGGAHAAQSL